VKEVVIYTENEVLTEGWPPIYYYKESHGGWNAIMDMEGWRFHIEKSSTADEAIARLEQAVVEHFMYADRRQNISGRRAYDGTTAQRHFSWPAFGRRKEDSGNPRFNIWTHTK
jgi:hypothetical protein